MAACTAAATAAAARVVAKLVEATGAAERVGGAGEVAKAALGARAEGREGREAPCLAAPPEATSAGALLVVQEASAGPAGRQADQAV